MSPRSTPAVAYCTLATPNMVGELSCAGDKECANQPGAATLRDRSEIQLTTPRTDCGMTISCRAAALTFFDSSFIKFFSSAPSPNRRGQAGATWEAMCKHKALPCWNLSDRCQWLHQHFQVDDAGIPSIVTFHAFPRQGGRDSESKSTYRSGPKLVHLARVGCRETTELPLARLADR